MRKDPHNDENTAKIGSTASAANIAMTPLKVTMEAVIIKFLLSFSKSSLGAPIDLPTKNSTQLFVGSHRSGYDRMMTVATRSWAMA